MIAQKVVSKAEGRIVRLADVTPTPEAVELAGRTGRDARLCQLYLDESAAVTEVRGRHVVTVHRLGFTGTGAGVDMSNVANRAEGYAVLLPADPDASARAIRAGLRDLTGATVGGDRLGLLRQPGARGRDRRGDRHRRHPPRRAAPGRRRPVRQRRAAR